MICLCFAVFFGYHCLTICVRCQVCGVDMVVPDDPWDQKLSWNYCKRSRMHTVCGKTEHFKTLLGKDCKETPFPCGTGVLQVVEGHSSAEITLKWTPKRPGTLWLIFGGFRGLGPVLDAAGTRGVLWETKRTRA
jgi:hypothetical protein